MPGCIHDLADRLWLAARGSSLRAVTGPRTWERLGTESCRPNIATYTTTTVNTNTYTGSLTLVMSSFTVLGFSSLSPEDVKLVILRQFIFHLTDCY